LPVNRLHIQTTPPPSSVMPAREIETPQGLAPSRETEADPVQTDTQIDEVIQQVGDAVSQMKSTRLLIDPLTSAVDNASSAYNMITTLANTWEPLLAKLKVFSLLVDEVAEVQVSASKPKESLVMDICTRSIHMQRWHGMCYLLHTRFVFGLFRCHWQS
jgi:hypothetical protein